MRWQERPKSLLLPHLALFALAIVVAALFARPFSAASVAWDTAASVLHFERLVAGRQLEAFVPTTPKPLLTLVFGTLWTLTSDWRVIAWATIGAFSLGTVLAAEVVRRRLGWAAWAWTGLALTGCLALLYDVGYALATPWALLFVATAGLALSAEPRRSGVAGLLLGLAVLARLEVAIALALAALLLAARAVAGDRLPGGRPRRSEWLVLVGLVALPVMAVHDTLLTGDPLFWATVASRYSEATRSTVLTVPEMARFLGDRYAVGVAPLTVVALVGLVELVQRRQWLLLAAIAAFGPGVALLLVALAARGIYVPPRYTAPIDVATIVAAAGAAAWADRLVTERVRRPWSAPAAWLAPAVAAVVAIVVVWPSGALDTSVRAAVARNKRLATDDTAVRPVLRTLVRAEAEGRSGRPPLPPGTPLVLLPNNLVPRLAVELDVPITTFGILFAEDVDPARPFPAVGQVVLHDRNNERAIPSLEVTQPAPFGPARAVPLAVDPRHRWWLVEIRAG